MHTDFTLTNVRIWDGIADGYIEADAIRIADGRISAIGRSRLLGGGADAIDQGGLTVLPGLIDAHVHMCLDPEVDSATAQAAVAPDALRSAMTHRADAMVRAGITTARDLGGGTWVELELRDRIFAGATPGPRLVCAGQPITSPRGHCFFWGGEAANLEEALTVLARQIEHGVDVIKVMATGGNLTPGSDPVAAQFDEAVLSALVIAAATHGLRVAAHCHGTAGIRNAARAGVTTVEHCSWRGAAGSGTDFDVDTARTMAESGVWASPTLNSSWQRFIGRSGFEDQVRDNYRRMREAGVQLIASTDAGIPGVRHDDLSRALPTFAHFAGLTAVQTLRAATRDCAAALGLGAVTGAVLPGLAADLLLVEGDPFQDLSVVQAPAAVIARGVMMQL